MKRSRLKCILCCVLVACLLTGCNAIGLDVETQLIPPESSSEHEAIRTALDEYISAHTKSGETAEYTLKYPSGGQYLSAFIMLDDLKTHPILGVEDAGTKSLGKQVVAFYRRNSENALVHINLLQCDENGTWKSVADVEGKGQSVNQAEFADLNNDGTPELLIGWSMYNTRDSRLAIYDLDNNLRMRSFSDTYTNLIVADITADGGEDLLLLRVNSGDNPVSAEMYSFRSNNVIENGHALLDSGIVRFGEHVTARLTDKINGIYIDCDKEQGGTITELLYWNDGQLLAPLCDQDSGINRQSAREKALACRDIDGDGQIEWPVTSRMTGFEDTAVDETLWYTEWRSYDVDSDEIVIEFAGLIPAEDGYMLRLREGWEALPVSYNNETRLLTMYRDGDQWQFRLRAIAAEDKEELPEGYVVIKESDTVCYAVLLAEEEGAIPLEELLSLFYLLDGEEVR